MARIRLYLALAIVTIWMVSYIASVASQNYTGFQLTTPVMLIASGWLLGTDLKRNGRNGKHGRR